MIKDDVAILIPSLNPRENIIDIVKGLKESNFLLMMVLKKRQRKILELLKKNMVLK